MNTTQKSMDMLHGPLTGKIFLFAMPIALSSVLQQLFNAADTSVVGRFADANALAAVGTNGEIVALLVSLSAGLAVGANVLIARAIGEERPEKIHSVIHTAILLAAILGVLGMGVGLAGSEALLRGINTPESVLQPAVQYLRLYFLGYPFLLLYDFGAAVLRAKGDSRRPFLALVATGVVNVGLNLFFVIVCGLGVAGVAIATDLATAASALLVLWWLGHEPGAFRLEWRRLKLHKADLWSILAIGTPAAVQGAVFCLANIFLQAAINTHGAIAAAGSTIGMNFEYFGYYVITAFGQAATTFTSQNHAAGSESRCKKILGLCTVQSFVCSAAVCVPLVVWRPLASAVFSPEAAVIEAACLRILMILTYEPFCTFYEIPASYLRGCGYSAVPAALMVAGICVFRVLWVLTVYPKFGTLESLYIVWPTSWVLTNVLIWCGMFGVTFLERKKANGKF